MADTARYQGDMVDVTALVRYAQTLEAENERMRHPFRNVDAIDWRHLMSWIPDSGHGKFWKEVFSEIRRAHEQSGDRT